MPSVCLRQIDSLSEYGAEATFALDSWKETDYTTMQVGDHVHGFVGKEVGMDVTLPPKAEINSSPQNEQQEELPEPFVQGGPAQTCELIYS